MKPIDQELRELMDSRGWDQTKLGAEARTTPATVSRYLSGNRGRVAEPRVIDTLRKFESAFGLPEGYFLEEQLYNAEQEVRQLVRGGAIRLADLEALIAAARYEQKKSQ
ncbi:MAG: helix-turn-helix domain-containing protein [Actinobacteria bacterium]|nr:helix-turn-helix domain-containing protein [Actinomycetota bacterium]